MRVLGNTTKSVKGVRWESQNTMRVLAEHYEHAGRIPRECWRNTMRVLVEYD